MAHGITTRDPIDHLYYSQINIERGARSAQDLGVCSCENANCTILTTSMIAGTVIGTCISPGPGTAIGFGVGLGVGFTIIAVKESLRG